MIHIGGSKPQNISALNMQNKGKACLLLSVPPEPSLPEIITVSINYLLLKNILIRNANALSGALIAGFRQLLPGWDLFMLLNEK